MEAEDSLKALQLLREQDSICGRMEALASQQRTLLTREDTGPLLDLLADRMRLSEKLAQLASRLDPIRRRWSSYRTLLPSEEKAEADRLLAQTQCRVRRILEDDDHDARILAARRATVVSRLQATYSGGEAVAAYHAPVGEPGRFDYVEGGLE
jgi:hypothetical protein